MTTLIVFLCIMGYCFVAGFVYSKVWPEAKYRTADNFNARGVTALSAIFWPVAVPMLFGAMTATFDRAGRRERKQARQIDDAKHKQELARIEAETIRIQEQSLDIK